MPGQLVQSRAVFLTAELAVGVSLGQDLPCPFDARALTCPDCVDNQPGRDAEHARPEQQHREPPEPLVVPVRAGDERRDVAERGHAEHATCAALPPQRPQGGTWLSPSRGTRILPGGDSRADRARYVPSTMRPRRPSQLLFSAGLAGAIFALTLVLLSYGGFDRTGRDFDTLGVVLAALASLPLPARRLAPPPVLSPLTPATA